jgi:hypothetical protein
MMTSPYREYRVGLINTVTASLRGLDERWGMCHWDVTQPNVMYSEFEDCKTVNVTFDYTELRRCDSVMRIEKLVRSRATECMFRMFGKYVSPDTLERHTPIVSQKLLQSQQQKLIDLMFELAIKAREWTTEFDYIGSKKQTAHWVADILRECGFDTAPCGMSWGVLKNG